MGFISKAVKSISGDSSPWSAIASVAGPIIGAGLSAYGGYQANVASAEEAQRNRDWQERMANTAHQRQVADLRAAGLNPILSANSGAATGSGSQASIINPYAGAGDLVSSATQSYGSYLQAKAAEKQANTALRLSNSQIGKNYADIHLAAESAKTAVTQQTLNSAATAKQIADTDASKALALMYGASAAAQYAQARHNSALAVGQEQENKLRSYSVENKEKPFLPFLGWTQGDVQSYIGDWLSTIGRTFHK